MDRLSQLNAPQREAVLTLAGPLLILAGAGTGKTRVITHRIAELIRHGVPAERILSVTFTNKAAREMRDRALLLLGRRSPQRPLICTFHSLCVRILRQEIGSLGYPQNFAIYDRGDQEAVARTALRDIRVGDKTLRPRDLLVNISRWKMAGISYRESGDYVDNDLESLASIAYRKYQNSLHAMGALDFDDLLMKTNQLFDEVPEALERYQTRFDRVQIDEYQDTNKAQFDLVEALVRPHQQLCVVGDDDQSIYGWRGAQVEHILNFQHYFPDSKIIRLEQNYRCTDVILQAANRLVKHNQNRHPKQLIPNKSSTDEIRYWEYEDENQEAEQVVREITSLVQAEGVALQDVAILFRTNEQPRLFETHLRRAKLRYVLIGGQSFFDRREIRDMLAYLKVIANPADEISLLRIINTPARGISSSTVQKVMNRAVQQHRTFLQVVPEAAAAGDVTMKAHKAIDDFHILLERYRRKFATSTERLDETLRALIEDVGYEDEIQKQYKNPDQQLLRSEMIEQLIDSLRQYTAKSQNATLAGFLEETALSNRDEAEDVDNQASDNAIKLMTLHSAKGLEFRCVFMVGLEEGLLPHRRSLQMDASAIAEERRLAYVGITRAMDLLTVTRTTSRTKWGKRQPSIPSRFLFEMRDTSDIEETEE